ncbi:MAG: GtrA family protein [Lentimicrobiaceae bacterium]|jgi:putative flippase GtrA|nr:GtrA family protein [Lentimicrobiaceae bacterium]MBT3453856.1 GtrA family protein [Lentimicrobiaceae bacterium]MBT3818962.1 GtrA family protein [Lentimicrobiaceae bacterium]MBT4060730.1 GtrA family protein [Lentimicrobiaceae bacterium]MBT4190360.1 GtrA family protein [Lentimicrobiaceae bacterium]
MNEVFNSTYFLKFLKFSAVGLSGLFIDFGITFIAKEKLQIPKYIANAIGFISAATSNYYFNRIWTFESNNPEILMEYTEFFVISIIGLGLNTLLLWFLVSRFKMNFYVGKIFAIALVTVWNFLANMFITFNPERAFFLY